MTTRNSHFSTREPFRQNDSLTLRQAHGPLRFLNPTGAQFSYSLPDISQSNAGIADADAADEPSASATDSQPIASSKPFRPDRESGVSFLWRSRDNRKGRHRLQINSEEHKLPLVDPSQTRYSHVLKGIIRTFTCYPIWDISWLVAFIFTLGSVVWVINGFFSWLPLVDPSTEFDGEIYYGGGITAFIGAILFFEVGSVLLILEAVNTNHEGCFGWAIEHLGGKHGENKQKLKTIDASSICHHHHANRRNLIGKPLSSNQETPTGKKQWQWFPTWQDLRKHYIHEIGFLAGAAQLVGATVFGVAGFTALPGIANQLTPQWRLNAAYWIPQVVGGSGFIVSSALYMLETQEKWWKPAPRILGWHIAFWNLIGAFGFTLCGALGMAYDNAGAQYQAALATFWGSWAFLIGSYLQLYESLDKHPVTEIP